MAAPDQNVCPFCLEPLGGLGRFCWNCERYTDDAQPASPKKPKITDTRSEDERKADARPAVEALGWMVLDLEQGFRPFECRHCGKPIAGGTRVPTGTPDWLVMGHGLMAWVEWKSGTGKLSDAQKAFRDSCRVAGVPWAECRTTEQAVAFLRSIIEPEESK